jgi:hypothetical protein
MSNSIYQIGDLITLKPHCWKHLPQYENSVGLITGLGFHSQTDKSFYVRFEKLVHILKRDRIIWLDDILQHYPVIK